MKIGAQLFSINNLCGTEEDLRKTFKAIKEMGYDYIQVSGFAYDAKMVREIADENGLKIALTHSPIPDIIEKTDEIIEKHKIMGADVVGIGNPGPYTVQEDNTVRLDDFINDLAPAAQKIEEAGLKLAFHNHFIEFYDRGGYTYMDRLYNETSWNFILDTAWVHYAGLDVIEIIKKYKDRLKYVHVKDYSVGGEDIQKVLDGICPLYEGLVPVDDVLKALEDVGTVEIAFVEQDNASKKEDPLGEMKKSIEGLKAHGWV